MLASPVGPSSRGRSPCPSRSGPSGGGSASPSEARRRPGQPGQSVRGDPPQHRLDGARSPRRPGRAVRPWPPARRERDDGAPDEGPGLLLAEPKTYMNDSGVAVRKLLARDRVPLRDLLVVTDDFALPFGKLRFRESAARTAGTTDCARSWTRWGRRSSAGSGLGSASPARGAIDHVLSTFEVDEKARSDPPRCLRRRGRGVGPRRDVEGRQPVEQLRASGAGRRRRGDGRRQHPQAGRGRGAGRCAGHPADEDRLAPDPARRHRRDAEGSSGKGGKR